MQTNLYACLKQLQLKREEQNLVSIHNFSQTRDFVIELNKTFHPHWLCCPWFCEC
jgi:hypothetical protein